MAQPTLIFLAGIGNSGPEHWQRIWHEREGGVWVEHESWDYPVHDAWTKDLEAALAAADGPKIVVAHSLGCLLATDLAGREDSGITGAFLVAVPDARGDHFPEEAEGFNAPPYGRLPFPAVVVASQDDPYGSAEHAAAVAEQLGAELVDVGAKGHINASSGLADWPEGWSLFNVHLDR
jgi:predicted alpha/beta hydrolase family esterase